MTQSLRHLVVATATALLTCTCAVAPNSSLEPTANAIPTAASVASGPVPSVEDADLARAKAAAAAFSGKLRSRLHASMQEGGPTAAIGVCHSEAPGIADAVMAEHGVRLGRVALPGRNRHPAHAAVDWQFPPLEQFQRAVADGAPAASQVLVMREGLPDGVALRMMRGIATEPACLACHGSPTPEVSTAIRARYPQDAATGFAVGDLRGALWVEVPSARPDP